MLENSKNIFAISDMEILEMVWLELIIIKNNKFQHANLSRNINHSLSIFGVIFILSHL
jgi:hypothetical protein